MNKAVQALSSIFAVGVLAGLTSGSAHANLLLNPGFEVGTPGGPPSAYTLPTISDWTPTGRVFLESNGNGAGGSSNYVRFGQNSASGVVKQDVFLTAGDYLFSLFTARTAGQNSGTTRVTVDAGGITSQDFAQTPGNFDWQQSSFQFSVATDVTATISILDGADSASDDPGIDNVSLTRVPAPATVMLLALGLIGMSAARKKRV